MRADQALQAAVIGAGLAGCEAAWALANAGFSVTLYEMKPERYSPAHKFHGFAELVCSNSLKAERAESAAGMLKAEMRRLGSLVMECADLTRVPAGGALAVDRERFSLAVTEKIRSRPEITVVPGEVTKLPAGAAVICTGPLTAGALADEIKTLCGDYLSFHDAAAPIVETDSIDLERVFYAARYDRGEADYINCPMDKDSYLAFHDALVHAEAVELRDYEKEHFKVYEGCMPIEVLAKRGVDTMRFGPLKPVGLTDPATGRRPYAVIQLRAENTQGTLYNLVGFQTNLKFGEQKRVFSMIPGLENAVFARYGVMHRNTFLDAPRLLTAGFQLKSAPHIFFGGQITGVEGYTESAASGILAGMNLARSLTGQAPLLLPRETMLGALCSYISDGNVRDFQPMGANMGILPPLAQPIRDKKLRYEALSARGLAALDDLLKLAL
ncbi:MAG: methylenetetrahydrofolate--tRNA-(uracil(54)-C(5))-methyltransferase (FADH(2)-oxidizing) TrmFO [Oscillospiraceae bacterium]